MQVFNRLAALLFVFSHAVAMRVETKDLQQQMSHHEQEADERGQDLGGLAAKISYDVCVKESPQDEPCTPYTCEDPSLAFDTSYPWSASDEHVLGSGCAGKVWRGRCAGKHVVVKAQKAVTSARCEASLMEKNLSSSIVRAFATNSNEDCTYTVMEYANAGTLSDYIDKRTLHLESAMAVMGRIFFESLLALQKLHNMGLVHRDLKPDNIFITSGRDDLGYLHPKLGDLGYACYYKKIYEDRSLSYDDPCRRCDDLAGTSIYLSPTYVNAYGHYDDDGQFVIDVFPADDLWSMGKILLQIVHRTNEEVKVDLEKEEISKCTQKNEVVNLYKMRAALIGKDLVSENMKNSAPLLGKPRLQELLSFLLCSGCNDPVGKGPEATEKAIALTKTWLEEELNLSEERMDTIGLPSVAEIAPECSDLSLKDQ